MSWPAYGPRVDVDGEPMGGGGEKLYASRQERNRIRKRAKRERAFLRRHAAGETTEAEVEEFNRRRVASGLCPLGCPCYDCSFGRPEAPTRRVVRFTGGGS